MEGLRDTQRELRAQAGVSETLSFIALFSCSLA